MFFAFATRSHRSPRSILDGRGHLLGVSITIDIRTLLEAAEGFLVMNASYLGTVDLDGATVGCEHRPALSTGCLTGSLVQRRCDSVRSIFFVVQSNLCTHSWPFAQ